MPPSHGKPSPTPAALVGARTILFAAALGIALSLTAFVATDQLQARAAVQRQEREQQRLLRIAGDRLARELQHQLAVTKNIAARFDDLPQPRERQFSEFAERALAGAPDLDALLWFKGDRAPLALHRAFPLAAAPRFADTTLASAAAPAPGRAALATLPIATQPGTDWLLTPVALRDSATHDTLAGVVDIARVVATTEALWDDTRLQLRVLLPAGQGRPTRFLHAASSEPSHRVVSTRLGIAGQTVQLDLLATPDAPPPVSRSAWLALGSGASLTLFGLGYLLVLRRRALRYARLQQALGKRLAQQVRQETEQDLRLKGKAIEASYNAIVISDASRALQPIIYVNEACERMTGYARDELLGRSPNMLLAHEKNQPAMIELRAALKRGDSASAQVRCYRRDGTMFWNELSISPVSDAHGKVTHILAVMSDITDRKRFADQLLHQSTHDQLTGLPNRILMQDRLNQAVAHAHRYRGLCGMLLINLDRLKAINESLGHRIGNQVLKAAGEHLAGCARGSDTVARLSGDEFVVILPQLNEPEQMTVVAQRILDSLAHSVVVEGHDLKITCSIGGSIFPKDGEDAEALLRNADIALGRAKRKGKNRFEFFTQEMNINAAQRLRMETDLRHAVENGELTLHFQPRVDLSHGRVVGVEALVRWQHPERGMIPPGTFIPIAEESGLIPHIGDWVLHAACQQLRQWQQAGLPQVAMAVNLSALQLQRQELPREIGDALSGCQIEPRFLELELTETVVMENAADAVTTLRDLKALGISLAMDDFGTGYSSLAYLRRFPFDYLKIDRSFIANLTREPDEAAIARTIIAMAHSLRLKVIAEGVETEAQARYLQRHYCDEMQGFLFSRPLPAAEITQLLQQRRTLFDNTPIRRGAQRTVLIVDDQVDSLNALRRILLREGYRILTTPSPLEALEMLASEGAEVVISDQRMPEMSGVEFLSRVRELHPDTIRIELTGSTDIRAAVELINRGAIFRFLTKPCDDDELRRNVREAFQSYDDAQRLKRASGDV